MTPLSWSRSIRRFALPIAAVVAVSTGAAAQEPRAPSGPIEISVPSGAGGTADVLMRQMARILTEEGIIDVPMVIVNRPGGAWAIGTNWVIDRPGEENLAVSFAEPIMSTPIVQAQDPWFEKLTPLGIFIQTQLMVVARPDHEADTLAEMVEYARANPEAVIVAGASAGSTDEQVTGLIEIAADVDLTYLPHESGGAAAATFLGGNTDMLVATIDEALPMVQAGNAKPLAILNAERRTDEALADIPTAREQGVDVVWGQYFGVMGPADLDPAVVAWWDEALTRLVESEAWQSLAAEGFLGAELMNSEQMGAFLPQLHESRLDILRAIGATPL